MCAIFVRQRGMVMRFHVAVDTIIGGTPGGQVQIRRIV